MVLIEEYYKKLYELLLEKNKSLFDRCLYQDSLYSVAEPQSLSYKNFKETLNQIEQKYGFEMHMNYKQLILWQKSFLQQIDIEKAVIAGKLVTFCCLADNILDSRRFSATDKQYVCECIENFLQDDVPNNSSERFPELKMLSNDVIKFYESNYIPDFYHSLKEDLCRAFESELYMYRSPLDKKDFIQSEKLELLVDKSIMFEKAALLTASFNHNNYDSIKAAELIGNVFWIVDDLCDLIDDIYANRKNSMLFFNIADSLELSITKRLQLAYENIENTVDYLMNVLSDLEKLVSKELFNFMVAQIWKWCFNVRKIAE